MKSDTTANVKAELQLRLRLCYLGGEGRLCGTHKNYYGKTPTIWPVPIEYNDVCKSEKEIDKPLGAPVK